jgi:hypothetical protein
MKMQGLRNNLIYRPYCNKKETNQAGYQEENTHPNMQGKPMRNIMRKKNHPKIQPNKGFLSLYRNSIVMTETREDSTTIKTHPRNTLCTRPIECQLVYIRVYKGNNHVYVLKHCQVEDKDKKLIFKMKMGFQAIRQKGNSI